MPPTVKSREERIDGMAEDVTELKSLSAAHAAKLDMMGSQLASVVNGLATNQAQMATMIARSTRSPRT